MAQLLRKSLSFFIPLLMFTLIAGAQNASTSATPFSGSKDFRKFSIGINAGVLSPSVVVGGSNDFSKNLLTLGYGANIRYQINHYLAVQADFLRGTLKGNQDKALGTGDPVTQRPVVSFETDLNWAGSINGQLTFGNVNWLSVKNTIVPYLSAGAGYASYKPTIVYNGTTTEVAYSEDDIQEFFVPVGLGFKINLSNMINLDLGYRMHFVDGDNLDGASYWATTSGLSSTVKKDKFSYGFAGLEFALGNKAKKQLLFDNPAARASSFLQSNIDKVNTRVDSVVANMKGMEDTDGDGVADIFDKEANTPAGSPVDSHGVSADTDGDGVPDFKDKQLITPTECQPVDADGVGKCPDPECCKTMTGAGMNANCPSDYPSLNFRNNSNAMSNDALSMIATIAAKMKTRPDCQIVINGYPEASKSSQAVCQRRLESIKMRLVEKEGISADRISTNCEVGGGDKNTIDISSN